MKLKRARLISSLFICLICTSVYAQKFNLLVGTYTSPGNSDGIYVYEFDSKTGSLSPINKISGISNPAYLTLSPDGKHVYSVNESGRGTGAISSFSFESKTGELKFVNKQPSGGDGPCYVSIDPTGKFVFAANYGGGTLSAYIVLEDGSLGADIQTFSFEGSGLNKARQEKPHLHCAVVTPDGKFLTANDLGSDKTYIYSIDPRKKTSPLTPGDPAFISAASGSGPRHITFHPNKKFAYRVHELDGTVSAFSYSNGKLNPMQTIPSLAENFTGTFSSADIHVSPDGKFLYTSNRGVNELIIYSINDKTGKLTFVGRQSSMGKTPRNFSIDPTGNFLLAAHQDSNDIIVFKRDKQTGLLSPTDVKVELSKPVCLVFGTK